MRVDTFEAISKMHFTSNDRVVTQSLIQLLTGEPETGQPI